MQKFKESRNTEKKSKEKWIKTASNNNVNKQ